MRPTRPELEDLVAYDAKEVKAEVILASNEHPLNLPAEIITKLEPTPRRLQVQPLPGPDRATSCVA